MVAVTGITAERAQEIEDGSVVAGNIDTTTGHLLLTQGDGTVIDAGVARPDAAIAAAVLVETNNRVADVNAEEAARIAADATLTAGVAALQRPATLSIFESTNFSFTNTTPSPTSGGGPQLEGTIVVPPTGKLKIVVSAILRTSAGGGAGSGGYVGFEVRQTNVSGAVLQAFNTSAAAMNENLLAVHSTSVSIITGLTPGSTVYIRAMHQADSGATGAVRFRRIIVEGIF